MSDRTRVLRYKRSALASMGAQEIMLELESIVEACDGIRYYIEQADGDETLLNALDGDEDEAWEFGVCRSIGSSGSAANHAL